MNIDYSLDMVRLKVRCKSECVEKFFLSYENDINVKFYQTTKFKDYRYNWTFTQKNEHYKNLNSDYNTLVKYDYSSYYVGFYHNAEKSGKLHNMVIEFNPNKVDLTGEYIFDILKEFFYDADKVFIQSCDIAIDLPSSIKNFYIDKTNRSIKKIFDYGGDDKTIYVGSGNGRTKIYNKRKEILKKEKKDIGYDLTRFETSLEFKDFKLKQYEIFGSEFFNIIDFYIIDEMQFDFTINSTDKALVFAVLNGYPMEELSRDKRQKIKKILSASTCNTIDNNKIISTFKIFFKNLISLL